MTPQAYRLLIRSFGLTPCRPSSDCTTLHESRDGALIQITDPEELSFEERDSVIGLIKRSLMITDQ